MPSFVLTSACREGGVCIHTALVSCHSSYVPCIQNLLHPQTGYYNGITGPKQLDLDPEVYFCDMEGQGAQ